MLDIVTHRTTQNDQYDTMIGLLREVALSPDDITVKAAFPEIADKLETNKTDVKDQEVKILLKKWDTYIEATMTEPEAIMREDLLYDQEQQRQYERQVHREKAAWEIDRQGVFRLPKEERVKIGNTGMHKRTTIPRPTAPVVKLPKRPNFSYGLQP